ncbi:YjdJ family protein [Metabacillus litoralis]|uniref:YjdJ family protein n=1 Tax=Metabacillus litoralis TaxID=152268 RepID=UPI001CFECD86|nr:YjdJ family protein [Metabacillus litoralis]
MIRFIIQFGIFSILFLFSTAASWYEGSAILNNPWEWKYSTPFTTFFYGGVNNQSDISQLDYFIYAFKFLPTYPVIMVLSSMYLLILIGNYTLKKRKWFIYYLFFLSGGCFLVSYLTINSITVGGRILFFLFIICGICLTTISTINFQLETKLRKVIS